MEKFKERLEYHLKRALEAERILKEAGGAFDPNSKTVKIQGPNGRPVLLLNRCFVALYAEMVAREGRGMPSMPKVRKDIAGVLQRYFPSEQLDSGPRRNIAKAIEKYLQGAK